MSVGQVRQLPSAQPFSCFCSALPSPAWAHYDYNVNNSLVSVIYMGCVDLNLGHRAYVADPLPMSHLRSLSCPCL